MAQCGLKLEIHAREGGSRGEHRERSASSELRAKVLCQLGSFSGSILLDDGSEMGAGDTYGSPMGSACSRMESSYG